MVGLGTIAQTHLAVLQRRSDVAVIGGVDPEPKGHHPFPVHAGIDEALAQHDDLDLVVIATPTSSHIELVDRLLRETRAVVLSEKPLAVDRQGLDLLTRAHAWDELVRRVKVAHHFAFSPEVEWALAWVSTQPGLGPPRRVRTTFNDAYAALPEGQLAGYVSSWVDSCPNQLSIVASFVDGLEVISHADLRDRAVTALGHAAGDVILTSNWAAADTSKQTEVEFASGAWLRMDHTSMTVVTCDPEQRLGHVAYTGSVGRKEAHYLGVYEHLLDESDDPRLGLALAELIAQVLEDADAVRSPADVTWSSIEETGAGPA